MDSYSSEKFEKRRKEIEDQWQDCGSAIVEMHESGIQGIGQSTKEDHRASIKLPKIHFPILIGKAQGMDHEV